MTDSQFHTFRSLEIETGWSFSNTQHSPLENWYEKNRDTPIENLTDGDLARCCRQDQYLDYIMPICIERLEKSPSSGEMCAYELLFSMNSIHQEYWRKNTDSAKMILRIISSLNHDELNELFRDEIEALIYSLEKALRATDKIMR